MMNNNKILTVSYGTFSCTLEGFEDSFETMKAIAEYFRDLAADDRYFGAEPPQPDAEMLARIAEREVARRVEAREHEGRIMLKAHEEPVTPEPEIERPAPAAVAAAATAVAEAAVPPEVPQAPVEPAIEPHVAAAPEAASVPAFSAPYTDTPEPPAEAHQPAAEPVLPQTAEMPVAEDSAQADIAGGEESVDSVAAFFAGSHVEDAADPETEETISVEAFTGYISPAIAAEAPAEDAGPEAHAAIDDIDDDADAEAEEETADPIASVMHTAADPGMDSAEDMAVPVADLDEEDEDVAVAEEIAAPVTKIESFADKLARIRAVVSKHEDDDAEDEEEDLDDDLGHSAVDAARSPMTADAGAAVAEDQGDPMADEDETDAALIAEAAQDIEDALEADEQISAEDTLADFDDVDDDLDDLNEVLRSYDRADAAAKMASEDQQDEDDNLFAQSDAAPEDETAEDADPVTARVMKVSKADLQAALEAGDLEEYEDDALAAEHTLSETDEEDLQRELADLDAVETEKQAAASSRGNLPAIDEDTGEDVSRLMAEADHQMAEPESKTRRNAFAHLRAAVAARFADRTIETQEKISEEKAEAYRSDLAEVVKPRRPESGDQRSVRPAEQRQAPLKLVAEQRIDTKDGKRLNAVAPRRVAASADEETEPQPDSGFAAYAEERGASTLPELLEAAASYMCFVEGQDEFSRPQLMTRVRQADCGDFSREDGLRSFGQLLRTGKIEKLKGGRFAASDAIGYKPDHRAAG